MELIDAIKTRRSVRSFSNKEVPIEKIYQIIDAANNAPSACDIQGCRFILVNDQKVIKNLLERGAASFIKNIPTGILVIYNNQSDNIEYKDHIQSASAAIQNMLLVANSIGLGACWICHLPSKKELRKIFKIPHNYDPIAYIAIGYPTAAPKERPRKHSPESLLSINRFEFNEKVPSKIDIKLTLKRIGRKIYYMLPFRKYIRKIVDDFFEKKFD